MVPQKVNASIITIGDELLIGQTIDTNSAWMGQELNKIGVWVKRRVAVGDVWDDIWHALDEESTNADIIFITGGLGPTADDITKPLLCAYFGGKLVVDEGALQNVKAIFTKLNRPIIDRNLKQAEVPDVCTVIPNRRGTAPGMWFTQPILPAEGSQKEKIFISLPGVPHEMKGMMSDYIIPRLPDHFTMPAVLHRTAFTAGQGESFIAELLLDFETSLPSHIKLAYLPSYGMVRLRLTSTGADKIELEKELDVIFNELKKLVKDFLVIDKDEGLETVIGNLLHEKGRTMATAESCTGGYIAHLITSIAGSSVYYKGSIVSYANETKENLLHVNPATLQEFGAVSEQTVTAMARGALEQLHTDYVVATSGIMGPGGGTDKKPAGTVWIAVAGAGKIQAQQFFFRFDRIKNIELTAQTALNMLRKFILSE